MAMWYLSDSAVLFSSVTHSIQHRTIYFLSFKLFFSIKQNITTLCGSFFFFSKIPKNYLQPLWIFHCDFLLLFSLKPIKFGIAWGSLPQKSSEAPHYHMSWDTLTQTALIKVELKCLIWEWLPEDVYIMDCLISIQQCWQSIKGGRKQTQNRWKNKSSWTENQDPHCFKNTGYKDVSHFMKLSILKSILRRAKLMPVLSALHNKHPCTKVYRV